MKFVGRRGKPRERAYVTIEFDHEEFEAISAAANAQAMGFREFIKSCIALRLNPAVMVQASRLPTKVSLSTFKSRSYIQLVVKDRESGNRRIVSSQTNDKLEAQAAAQRLRELLQQMPVCEAIAEFKVIAKAMRFSGQADAVLQTGQRPSVHVPWEQAESDPELVIRVWKTGKGRLALRFRIGESKQFISVPTNDPKEAKKFAVKLSELLDCNPSLREQRIARFREVLNKEATAMRDRNNRRKQHARGFIQAENLRCNLEKILSQLTSIGEPNEPVA